MKGGLAWLEWLRRGDSSVRPDRSIPDAGLQLASGVKIYYPSPEPKKFTNPKVRIPKEEFLCEPNKRLWHLYWEHLLRLFPFRGLAKITPAWEPRLPAAR